MSSNRYPVKESVAGPSPRQLPSLDDQSARHEIGLESEQLSHDQGTNSSLVANSPNTCPSSLEIQEELEPIFKTKVGFAVSDVGGNTKQKICKCPERRGNTLSEFTCHIYTPLTPNQSHTNNHTHTPSQPNLPYVKEAEQLPKKSGITTASGPPSPIKCTARSRKNMRKTYQTSMTSSLNTKSSSHP